MIRAKNYETMSKFVKVMTKILWPLFFRTRCISLLTRDPRSDTNILVIYHATQLIQGVCRTEFDPYLQLKLI